MISGYIAWYVHLPSFIIILLLDPILFLITPSASSPQPPPSSSRRPPASAQGWLRELIHHSDQGVQYASWEYVDKLKENGIKISMSRKGNPYDNAFAESFIKTLKYEEVYLWEYESFDEAHKNIKKFLEVVYNKRRVHSSIGYVTPEEFEKSEGRF